MSARQSTSRIARAMGSVDPQRPLLRPLPENRPLIAAIGLLLLACIVVAGLLFDTLDAAFAALLMVPIGLAALEFGLRGGLLGAALATAAVIPWSLSGAISDGPIADGAFVIAFFGVGGAVGYVATQMRRAYEAQREVLERAGDAIIGVDSEGRIVYANPAVQTMLGYRSEELVGEPLEMLVPQDLARRHVVHRAGFLSEPHGRTMGAGLELSARRSDGTPVLVDISLSPVETQSGLVVVATIRDLEERRHAEQLMGQREHQLQALFEGSDDAMLVTDAERRLVDANPAGCELLGLPRERLLELRIDDIAQPPSSGAGQSDLEAAWAELTDTGRSQGEYELVHPDGSTRVAEYRATSGFLPDRQLWVLRDVTERRRAEERIAHMAYHDQLTSLPNRQQFSEQLELALLGARRADQALAVLYLDFDRFKLVNDTLGHAAGDELLQKVSRRLQRTTRGEDILARHSGDEFLMLLGNLERDSAEASTRRLAARVHEHLQRPVMIRGRRMLVDASIGASLFPVDANSAEALIHNADVAMYEAKRAGRGETRLHGPATADPGSELSVSDELRTAIDRHELVLHYQPFVELESGRALGVEALVRWEHPHRGLLMPAQLIPAAEEAGLIPLLSDHVMDVAFRQASAWSGQGLQISVSCNLSTRDVRDRDLLARIDRHLEQTEADPAALMIEVSEAAAAADPSRARIVIEGLRARGLRVAIDDFGVGDSSLGILREMASANLVKVDRSFIRDAESDRVARTIVKGVVTMAGELGLSVLAEGIETEAERDLMLEYGCQMGQGYHFGRPLPPAEIVAAIG